MARNITPPRHQNGHHHHHGTDRHDTDLEVHRHFSGCHHGAGSNSRRRLVMVLVLTAAYMVAEFVGGWLAGSLALVADAGHMLTDVAALVLALLAAWFSRRPATPSKTFGYHRMEILAALINGVALILISLYIFYEAYERVGNPPIIESNLMISVAAGGLIVNLVSAWLLHGADTAGNLNMRGVWLHIMGDVLGSLGAIIAGLLVRFYGWQLADSLVSVLIGMLIIWSSWKLIGASVNVLLEGTPAHINLARVEDAIRETEGVEDVHDLHVWTITSGREALSAHVIHASNISPPRVLNELRAKLSGRFGVDHLTIQMETKEFAGEPFDPCHADPNCFSSKAK